MSKPKKVNLYFSPQGFCIFSEDDKCLALRFAKEIVTKPEDKIRRAWWYLGTGLKETLDDNYEFVDLHSNTKVIDQLRGAEIEDPECLMMYKAIVEKGIPKFAWVEYKKITDAQIEKKMSQAMTELTYDAKTKRS